MYRARAPVVLISVCPSTAPATSFGLCKKNWTSLTGSLVDTDFCTICSHLHCEFLENIFRQNYFNFLADRSLWSEKKLISMADSIPVKFLTASTNLQPFCLPTILCFEPCVAWENIWNPTEYCYTLSHRTGAKGGTVPWWSWLNSNEIWNWNRIHWSMHKWESTLMVQYCIPQTEFNFASVVV